MTILEELIQYANNCINDVFVSKYENYLSCQKHKWACMRFLKDLDRIDNDDDFNFYWDEEEAKKIVNWFKYLRHTKGILAGEPINLTIWQKFCLCQVYGWRNNDTKRRRFTAYFKQVGRKNAKSQEQAGVLSYEISVVSTKNKEQMETYCAGTKKDQSKIVFDECKMMIEKSMLRTKFKTKRNEVVHIKSGSFLRPLSKEDGKKGDGSNPACLVIDEYHQHPTSEFYDLGLGANSKEPLLMVITTAGVDLNHPCFRDEYELCSNILNPDIDVNMDHYFCDILELEKDDDITDENVWVKANPIRCTYEEGFKKIRESYQAAILAPEKMPMWLTKCMNVWVQSSENGYMDMEKWRACQVEDFPIDIKGMPVYVGFDMSAKIDLTSVEFNIPFVPKGKEHTEYITVSHSFAPSWEKLKEKELTDKVPYTAWAKQGYITVTNSPIVDQTVVENWVYNWIETHELIPETFVFDPHNSSKLMMDMSNKGYDCVELYQSYGSLNEVTTNFREEVYSGRVHHIKNPVKNFAMTNAIIKSSDGRIKIDKEKSTKRIDPVDAALCAMNRAMYHEFKFDINQMFTEENMEKLYGKMTS